MDNATNLGLHDAELIGVVIDRINESYIVKSLGAGAL